MYSFVIPTLIAIRGITRAQAGVLGRPSTASPKPSAGPWRPNWRGSTHRTAILRDSHAPILSGEAEADAPYAGGEVHNKPGRSTHHLPIGEGRATRAAQRPGCIPCCLYTAAAAGDER
jgi:hypothetical protein